MGEVWVARQESPIRRDVAIKFIKAGMDTRHVVARFESERQALALMDHPNIAKVFDAGTSDQGRPYFVMEYVKGMALHKYADEHRLSTLERLELIIQVCEGVQHAHQKGVLHRDLKPSNVLVEQHGNRAFPKIIDFGVAKAVAQPLTEATLHTRMGEIIGTPTYMSPEQASVNELDVDTRTDVYSLGVMLYHLLVGVPPFDFRSPGQFDLGEIQRRIREDDPPRPSTRASTLDERSEGRASLRQTDVRGLARQLRGDLDWIVMKAMEKDRTRRYASASELAQDIRRYLEHEPVHAGPPHLHYRIRKFIRRHRIGVGIVAGLFILLGGFSIIMAAQADRIALQRDRANMEAAAAQETAQFLVSLFKVSDPDQSRGATVSARELLDAGLIRIDRDLAEQPEVQARMMTTMGQV
jgi:non-specific serine/threonine protein kinase/serine/threonine-protein kinase